MSNPRPIKDSTITLKHGLYTLIDHEPTKFDYPQDTAIITRIPQVDPESQQTTECILNGPHKKILCDLTSPPRQLQTIEKSYEIKEAQGMGLGMFATRNINAGDLIVEERPYMVLPSGFVVKSSKIGVVFIQLEVIRMSTVDRANFQNLVNTIAVEGIPDILGRILTNALQLPELDGIGMGKEYICVPRDIARVNHSCVPNATLCMFNPKTFSCSLRAMRNIAKGEQIFRNYVPHGHRYTANQAQRNAYLSPLSFTCTCSLCRLSGPDLEACNAFRAGLDQRIFVIMTKLNALVKNPQEYIRCIDLPESHSKDVIDETWNLELRWISGGYVMNVGRECDMRCDFCFCIV